jgi:hypothetical protein
LQQKVENGEASQWREMVEEITLKQNRNRVEGRWGTKVGGPVTEKEQMGERQHKWERKERNKIIKMFRWEL